MGADVSFVFHWWGVLFLVGAVAFPLTKYLFCFHKSCQSTPARGKVDIGFGWWDGGYLFSKAVGMAVVTWMVYVMGTVSLMPFSVVSIGMALGAVFLVGLFLNVKNQKYTQSVTPTYVGVQSKTFPYFTLDPRVRGDDKKGNGDDKKETGMTIRTVSVLVLEEIFFFLALLFWSWVKGHEPSIRGLEKFMDYGFMQSILNSRFFPPADMWYAGSSINYYYFGHMVVAILTKLSGLDLAYTFNLMLATIFALTLTMSFSIGYQLMFICHSREGGNPSSIKTGSVPAKAGIGSGMTKILAGFLTAFLVTFAGNMQTLYAFTRGYTGDNVKPFWQLLWPIGEFLQKLPEGMRTYWYANATRFIPFTIHEFPSYSFVVSDVHGHVLSLPFTLLAIAVLIHLFSNSFRSAHDSLTKIIGRTNTIFLQDSFAQLVFYGFLVGVLLMTNALDGPIYLALLGAVLIIQNSKFKIQNWEWWKEKGMILFIVAIVAGLTSVPFLYHFKSFVNGLAINCPPAFFANSKFGPLIFEGVEKCQHSPLWMMALLWGFFVYSGFSLLFRHSGRSLSRVFSWEAGFRSLLNGSRVKPGMTGEKLLSNNVIHIEKLLIIFFIFALILIIFPEFFYFKDIYPAHFRSNTMFKLGYQAFILFSIVCGYAICSLFLSFPRKRESSFIGKEVWIRPREGGDRVGDDKEVGGDDRKRTFLRILFFVLLLPQLFLVSIYPYFSVRSYFGELKEYKGLDGLAWFAKEYPDDWAAIRWLNLQPTTYNLQPDRFAIVEADGDSYTDYSRFSAFTGIPTVVGWAVHEWLWRGSYDVVAPRREEVRKIYESTDAGEVREILAKYNVRYIVVGSLERQKFQQLHEEKFRELGSEVFRQGTSTIYDVIPGSPARVGSGY